MGNRAISEVIREYSRRIQSQLANTHDDFLHDFVWMQCVDAIQLGLGIDARPALAEELVREIRGALLLARQYYSTPWEFVPYTATSKRYGPGTLRNLSPEAFKQIATQTQFDGGSGVSMLREHAGDGVVYAALFGGLKTREDALSWLDKRYAELERFIATLEYDAEVAGSEEDAFCAAAPDSFFDILIDLGTQVTDMPKKFMPGEGEGEEEGEPQLFLATERVRRLCKTLRESFYVASGAQ
jgi:hypothetical protein